MIHAFLASPEELDRLRFSTVRVDLSGEAEVEAESLTWDLVITAGSSPPAPLPLSRLFELRVFIKFL